MDSVVSPLRAAPRDPRPRRGPGSRPLTIGARLALLALAAIAIASPAHADWAAWAYLGASHTVSNSLRLRTDSAELTFTDVGYRSESFRSPQYYGLRVGHYFHRWPWLGIEGELIHVKAFAEDTPALLAGGVRRFSMSHGLNYLLANIAWRRPLGGTIDRPRGWITARGGAGPTVPHTESAIGGVSQQQYEIGRLGGQLAAGAEMRVVSRLTAFGEYKLTRAHARVGVAGGTMEGNFLTHQIAFGLGWHP
jgi:Outer membrane protein beta-barrel domain